LAKSFPGEIRGCVAPPGFRSSVRFSFRSPERVEELLGGVGLTQKDPEFPGGTDAEADDLAAVVDRFRVSLEGGAAGFPFELQGEDLFDLRKRLSVRFRDPKGVVVEFAGGSVDETSSR